MKFMSLSFNAEQNQEETLQSSGFLFGKLTWCRKSFHTLILSLEQSTQIHEKSTVLITFKHNLKQQFPGPIFFTHLYIYLKFYLAAPRPTLGHYQGDSLTNPMLITSF